MTEKEDNLEPLIRELCAAGREREWVEFKCNNSKPDEIGEYVSALSNAAALHGQERGYIVWGVADKTYEIVGTTFAPESTRVGAEELENWLSHLLSPRLGLRFRTGDINGKAIVVLEVPAAMASPTRFKSMEYVRVGTYKKKLAQHVGIERELWATLAKRPFERGEAESSLSAPRACWSYSIPRSTSSSHDSQCPPAPTMLFSTGLRGSDSSRGTTTGTGPLRT